MAPPSSGPNPRVFLDIIIDSEPTSRVVIELFADKLPKTAENFCLLCTDERDLGRACRPLHYKGSTFHPVVPRFMCQGGDITTANGTGSETTLDDVARYFPDEGFMVRHTVPGVVTMANAGPNTNGSQFFITVDRAPWLDSRHVTCGRVVDGMDAMHAVKRTSTKSGKTVKPVVIADCSKL